jgi:hypothetical protein
MSGSVTIAPHSALGGTFVTTPSPMSISVASPTATFTVDDASAGSDTITTTNSLSLIDPAGVPYTVTAPIVGLVAQWLFSEGSGTTTADNTGNGNTGTLAGGISWTQGPS